MAEKKSWHGEGAARGSCREAGGPRDGAMARPDVTPASAWGLASEGRLGPWGAEEKPQRPSLAWTPPSPQVCLYVSPDAPRPSCRHPASQPGRSEPLAAPATSAGARASPETLSACTAGGDGGPRGGRGGTPRLPPTVGACLVPSALRPRVARR